MANKVTVTRFGFLLSLGALLTVASAAAAEEPTVKPDVACLQTPAKLSDSDLKSFIGNASALLADNQSGGLPLSNRVRDVAGSSSLAFDKIMEVTKGANAEQKAAIAAGLARVVYTCGNIGTEEASNYGALIQSMVASFGDTAFASAFLTASSEIKTAAVAPGAGGFSPGGGATGEEGQQSGENGYKSPGDGPKDTTSGNYTIGSANPVTDTTTTIISNSGL